jgi:hypothetical protein
LLSHAVGLERLSKAVLGKLEEFVSIPHGGLRTIAGFFFFTTLEAVSIPHGGLRTVMKIRERCNCEGSPSHTVGLEPVD